MIDSLEVVKSGLLDEIILSVALNSIEVRNFQSEDVKSRHLKHKFILMLDTCLMSIEECQKLATRRLRILFVVFLLSIFLLTLILLIQLLHLRSL